MSLSLTLVFERHPLRDEPVLATNKLDFGYVDHALFDALKPVSVPLDEGVEWHGDDSGLTLCKTDPYGDPLTFVSVALLVPQLEAVAKVPWPMAVVAFIRALPPSMRVVLWWH
ncbi:hypothetical protein DIE18_04380 [Burkholderia sp. Bp9125]|nr:hypothetical protein DIE18_04380 [Burkholderia sp. Bp9125]